MPSSPACTRSTVWLLLVLISHVLSISIGEDGFCRLRLLSRQISAGGGESSRSPASWHRALSSRNLSCSLAPFRVNCLDSQPSEASSDVCRRGISAETNNCSRTRSRSHDSFCLSPSTFAFHSALHLNLHSIAAVNGIDRLVGPAFDVVLPCCATHETVSET